MEAAQRGSVVALVPASGVGGHMALPGVCWSRTPWEQPVRKAQVGFGLEDLGFEVERETCKCLIHSFTDLLSIH